MQCIHKGKQDRNIYIIIQSGLSASDISTNTFYSRKKDYNDDPIFKDLHEILWHQQLIHLSSPTLRPIHLTVVHSNVSDIF